MEPAARGQNRIPLPLPKAVLNRLKGGVISSDPGSRLLTIGENRMRRKVQQIKGSKANPYLISKEDYLHTGTREKGTNNGAPPS